LVTHDIEEALNLGDKIIILTEKPSHVRKVIENIPTLDESKGKYIELKKLIEDEFK
jgi:NitT/TauT family transport system ATP-binding protein